MGKGDKKTAKGKRAQGSYGITRKRKDSTKSVVVTEKKEKAVKAPKEVAEKKPAAKKSTAAKATSKATTAKTEKKATTTKKTTKKEA